MRSFIEQIRKSINFFFSGVESLGTGTSVLILFLFQYPSITMPMRVTPLLLDNKALSFERVHRQLHCHGHIGGDTGGGH